MKAVILAGGIGTRLSEETVIRPKPMVDIGGRPILWHILKHYSLHGRLRRVRKHLRGETFCFTYGDGVSDVDITALVNLHREQGTSATLTVVQPPGRFGVIDIDENKILEFTEKPAGRRQLDQQRILRARAIGDRSDRWRRYGLGTVADGNAGQDWAALGMRPQAPRGAVVFRPRAVESLEMKRNFWRDRRVFITGHTGFKGTWLAEWLKLLGARITGFSLPDDDIRDLPRLRSAIEAAEPEIIFHLAAQSLVRPSNEDPVTTFSTNVIGTVHLLEAIRTTPQVRVAVLATSDKANANDGSSIPFREGDRLGGRDPYSSSKACAELAIAAYRDSFFGDRSSPRIVSVRAGNVIGGGDSAQDRIVPDLVRAFHAGVPARIRYPHAERSWQFVLDAVHGYLRVAEEGWDRDLPAAFNFGSDQSGVRSVRWLAGQMKARWGTAAEWIHPDGTHPHEAASLLLDTRERGRCSDGILFSISSKPSSGRSSGTREIRR